MTHPRDVKLGARRQLRTEASPPSPPPVPGAAPSPPDAAAPLDVPALDLAGLRVSAGRAVLLDGVDGAVPAGAVTAVVGPNGAGKSTLLRAVVGAVPLDAGAVLLSGRDLGTLTRRERARELALVEQDAPADVSRDVLDVVLLGRTPHRARWGADSAADLAVARGAMARTGAEALAGRDFATLSGGERQRVHLARALAQEPALLLLDEPTNHLDVGAQLAVLRLARDLAADGVTVLAALHDLNHALRFCDHVLVLAGGTVVAAGHPREVLTADLVSDVYGVRAHRLAVAGRDLLVLDPA
ncbi:ABC transporter ATP-binding protein [Georgenia thermotolerans]|uniref:ATP-binding cassette domain-containing protein n=1 Tax=Georgenia thermotolerans TaxID=527326 RepID=A0A7J5UQ01_9MICO|nr:ABC transporter ATP-binding protein [Georgenia thermotolerans]KAE8764311.1 ATP-binding cassette domain-containing protein [Georgenia thermotolerans]